MRRKQSEIQTITLEGTIQRENEIDIPVSSRTLHSKRIEQGQRAEPVTLGFVLGFSWSLLGAVLSPMLAVHRADYSILPPFPPLPSFIKCITELSFYVSKHVSEYCGLPSMEVFQIVVKISRRTKERNGQRG